MAGRGSHFYAAGYKIPKYEIVAHGRSLFEWSLLSLRSFLTNDCQLFFICLEGNKSTEFILNKTCRLGLNNVHIIDVKNVTDGQATSAYLSRELWNPNWPLLIYNIDTYIKRGLVGTSEIRQGSDGWVPTFRARGEHWSFVKLGADGWAEDLAEKNRISENASVGLYWFNCAGTYIELYERYFSNSLNLVLGEKYIAPLYRQLIIDGGKVSTSELKLSDVHVLGTPAELEMFISLSPSEI